jgi:hypothetical protein
LDSRIGVYIRLARDNLKQWARIEQKNKKSGVAKNRDVKLPSFPVKENAITTNEKEGVQRSTQDNPVESSW